MKGKRGKKAIGISKLASVNEGNNPVPEPTSMKRRES
jgi:hypothetical protein